MDVLLPVGGKSQKERCNKKNNLQVIRFPWPNFIPLPRWVGHLSNPLSSGHVNSPPPSWASPRRFASSKGGRFSSPLRISFRFPCWKLDEPYRNGGENLETRIWTSAPKNMCRFRLPPFTFDTRQHMIWKEIPSLKLTASSPLEMDGWNTIFLLGRPIFRGYVSFREGNLLEKLLAKNCICSPFVLDGEWKVSAPELKGYISVTNPRIGDRLESLGLHPRKIHILKPQTINHFLKAYRWIYPCRFLAPQFVLKKSSLVLQLHPNQDKQTCIP